MSDQTASGPIAALTIAYIELVKALGREQELRLSSLANTLETQARDGHKDEQTRASLLSIAKKILAP